MTKTLIMIMPYLTLSLQKFATPSSTTSTSGGSKNKKESTALYAPRSKEKPLSVIDSTISIPDLLELVNMSFTDVLLKADIIEKSTLSRAFFWRREGDSNPRDAINAYTISNRAP